MQGRALVWSSRLAVVAFCAATVTSVVAANGDVTAPAAGASLKFDQVFSPAGEPSTMHFKTEFLSQGTSHRLELWRSGQQLKRRTDDAIETVVHRSAADSPEYDMVVLNLVHRISTRIDRTNLYRVGNFTDWFDLAHGVRHPKGEYRLVRGVAPEGVVKPVAACDWFDLVQGGTATHVCWSGKSRLPMLMVDAQQRVVWRVTALDTRKVAASTFVVDDAGFIRNDANAEMDRD